MIWVIDLHYLCSSKNRSYHIKETILMSITLGELTNEECTICSMEFSTFRPGKLLTQVPSCNHCFCFVCLDRWGRRSKTCPYCRQPFRALRRLKLVGEAKDAKPRGKARKAQRAVIDLAREADGEEREERPRSRREERLRRRGEERERALREAEPRAYMRPDRVRR